MTSICSRMILLICAIQASIMPSYAQISTLTLKDGSRLRGYISVQRPGKDITFHSVEAEMYIRSKDIKTINENTVSFEDLSAGWRRQALQNNLLSFNGTEWVLPLSTIDTHAKSHTLVAVKERGTTVKYVQYAEDEYDLQWSEISGISRDPQDTNFEGCYDEITLRDGSVYTGIVIEQSPGKDMKIQERNGCITVVEQSQVKSSRKTPAAAGIDLWKVRPYTNYLELNDGTSRKGLIIYQQSGTNSDENYVDILKENGMQERINFMDIKEYHYEPRGNSYLYENNRIYIDEIDLPETSLVSQSGYMYTTDTLRTVLPHGIPVYVKSVGGQSLDGWQLTKMKKLAFDNSSIVRGFKTVGADIIAPLTVTSGRDEEVAMLGYGVLATGCYVLMNRKQDAFYVINIMNK